MVEANEVIVTGILLVGLFPIFMAYSTSQTTKYFALSYLAIFLGSIFTIAEDFVLGEMFNLLEHSIGLLLGGAFLLTYSIRSNQMNRKLLKIRGGRK